MQTVDQTRPGPAPSGDGPVLPSLDRRRLLLGIGAAVAAGAAPKVVWDAVAAPPAAGVDLDPLGPALLDETGEALCLSPFTYDTMAGVAAFVVPGDDPYSLTQGTSSPTPGAVAAGTPQLLALVLNQFLRDPTAITYLLERFADELGGVDLPDGGDVCHAIGSAIDQQGTVPLAPLITGLLSFLAVTVDPSSATGPHLAPFANLSWSDKAEVWRRFEEDLPALVKPDPLLLEVPVVSLALQLAETAGGVLEYAGGVLLPIAGLFAYAEDLAWDRETDTFRHRPVGWTISGYLPGEERPVDGWDELIGYYQGRTSADA